VDEKGAVSAVRVTRSLNPLLDKAAVDAIKEWIFAPTIVEGKAKAVKLAVRVVFILPDKGK